MWHILSICMSNVVHLRHVEQTSTNLDHFRCHQLLTVCSNDLSTAYKDTWVQGSIVSGCTNTWEQGFIVSGYINQLGAHRVRKWVNKPACVVRKRVNKPASAVDQKAGLHVHWTSSYNSTNLVTKALEGGQRP